MKVLECSEVWKTTKCKWTNFEKTIKKIVTEIQNILTHYIILKVLLTSNENDASSKKIIDNGYGLWKLRR